MVAEGFRKGKVVMETETKACRGWWSPTSSRYSPRRSGAPEIRYFSGAGFALLFEDLVEQTAQAGGASVTHARGQAGWGLAGLRKLVGKIQRGEDRDAKRIHGSSLGGHGAHFRVHLGGQLADVIRVVAGQMVRLVVDLDRHVIGGGFVHTPPYNSRASSWERSFSTRWRIWSRSARNEPTSFCSSSV